MSNAPWSLEVVRGRSVGRRYPLASGAVALGNAPGGTPNLDLSSEEGDGPRKMAARQALIEPVAGGTGIGVRDLDSPGGTFVNRQRVLPGLARPLVPGDVIQLGGVQLKLVAENGAPASTAAPAPAPSSTPKGWTFPLPGGVVCRSFDEILTVSAQRWSILRDEVTSGRADAFVRSIGRPDLAPPPSGAADDRLDAWLARLPTTKAKEPLLEVHPETLVVKLGAGGGGGRTRRTIAVSNVGYRLLKVDARVEPGAGWLTLAGAAAEGTLSVVESTNILLDVEPPDQPSSAVVTLSSNGGEKRVVVKVEASKPTDPIPSLAPRPAETPWLAGVSARNRLIAGAAGLAAARVVADLAAGLVAAGALVPEAVERPPLFGPAVVFAAAGAARGAAVALRRKERAAEVAAFAVSFGILGLFGAAGFVAACRTVEPLVGVVGRSAVGRAVLWGALGAGLARLSTLLVPPRPATEKST